jgi:HEAT repeat protein
MRTMAQEDFPTSSAVTGGDADLAAQLLMDAADALSPDTPERRVDDIETTARTSLSHRHPDVRNCAIAALARLGRATTTDLHLGVGDGSPAVRRRTVEAAIELHLRGLGDPEAILELLVGRLDDDALVSEVAAFGIGEFGPEPAVTAPAMDDAISRLEVMARGHDDPLCRESAVAALGAAHRGKEAVLAALDDKATVRRRAVLALAPFSGSDVDAALERALVDRDRQVRQAAEDQLSARGSA